MTNRDKKLFSLILIFLTIFSVVGCAGVRSWPEQKGQVLEVGTNKPIEGAVVVAKWQGSTNIAFVESQSTCYHVETVSTDKQGYYRIEPRFDGLMRGYIYGKHMRVDVYKEGYEFSKKTLDDNSHQQNLYYLKPISGTLEKRLEQLEGFIRVTSCRDAGTKRRNLFPAYEAIYNEVSKSNAKQSEKEWFLRIAARAAVSVDGHISSKDMNLKVDEFIEEYR